MRVPTPRSTEGSSIHIQRVLWALVLIFVLMTAASASEIRLSSGPQRVALVELYTSEGCSSCPPADARLSALTREDGLWRRFVPVAFHVGYWDDLGWPDRFGDPRFALRQRAYAESWGRSTVYTPAFVVNGRPGRRGLGHPSGAGAADRLEAVLREDRSVTVRFSGRGTGAPTVHVALLGFGLTSRVTAGENRGRVLRHDFVALDYHIAPMQRAGVAGGDWVATVRLMPPQAAAARTALAVWTSPAGDPAPLQAAGGWLPTGWPE